MHSVTDGLMTFLLTLTSHTSVPLIHFMCDEKASNMQGNKGHCNMSKGLELKMLKSPFSNV